MPKEETLQQVSVRLDSATIARADAMIADLRVQNPGWNVRRSDVLRVLILAGLQMTTGKRAPLAKAGKRGGR